MKTKSFRCTIPADYPRLVRADAIAFNKSVDGIATAVFQSHFAFKREERAKLYKNLPDKIMGRRIKQ